MLSSTLHTLFKGLKHLSKRKFVLLLGYTLRSSLLNCSAAYRSVYIFTFYRRNNWLILVHSMKWKKKRRCVVDPIAGTCKMMSWQHSRVNKNSNQWMQLKLGLLIIKLPKTPLHHFPENYDRTWRWWLPWYGLHNTNQDGSELDLSFQCSDWSPKIWPFISMFLLVTKNVTFILNDLIGHHSFPKLIKVNSLWAILVSVI